MKMIEYFIITIAKFKLTYFFHWRMLQDGKSTNEQCKATNCSDSRTTCEPEVWLLLFLECTVLTLHSMFACKSTFLTRPLWICRGFIAIFETIWYWYSISYFQIAFFVVLSLYKSKTKLSFFLVYCRFFSGLLLILQNRAKWKSYPFSSIECWQPTSSRTELFRCI